MSIVRIAAMTRNAFMGGGNASGGAKVAGVLLFTILAWQYRFADNTSAQHHNQLQLRACVFGRDIACLGGIVRSFTTDGTRRYRLEMEDLVCFVD
jgi:hypothetical protein